MDHNCIAIFSFVVLCWMSTGTYAEANTTMAAANVTEPESTNMTKPSTHMTTPSTQMTTPSTHMTTPSTNTTTPSTNMTTTADITANTTVAPVAPPIVANTTVEELTNTVSKTECGTKQLCASEPSDCDPSSNSSSCYFFGAKKTSGRNFEFSLSGESDGYLGASLASTFRDNGTVYICANNKSKPRFISAYFNNGTFTLVELPVNNVKGKITGRNIQCTFAVTVPDATTRAADAIFSVIVMTGPFNSDTSEIGTPAIKIQTNPVDLSDPTVKVTNLVTVTTVAPTTALNTTSHAITVQLSVPTALLLILGILSLAWL